MIHYTLRLDRVRNHLLDVEIRIPATGDTTAVLLPSWTPGSYLLREFPRNVQDFAACDVSGQPLGFHKTSKGRWAIDTAAAAGPVTLRYSVYANELTVRTSHADATHAAVIPASVFMWVEGAETEPIRIAVDLPDDWRVATSLVEVEGEYTAEDYDELVDSPLEIGTHRTIAWEQRGIPHRWVIWGAENPKEEELVADSRAIVEAAAGLFGGLPYDRYLFILHVVVGGRGGLEHKFSCSLQVPPEWLHRDYESLLALTAHELFHVWLGKRIRPAPLGPFDYTAENYTRNLWVVEGFTTYYTDRILLRAGLMSPRRYLERLGDSIAREMELPGRRHQSLEDSSFDTWIRFYRPDAHTPNAQISYYKKGALVAMALDLEIRRRSNGERSLDDVMRVLWERYGAKDVGFPEDRITGIQAVVEEVGGREVAEMLAEYVSGTAEIDWDGHLEAVGLQLVAEEDDHPDIPDGERKISGSPITPPAPHETQFGLRIRESGGKVKVTHVLQGGPAWEAGANVDDVVLSVGDLEASGEVLKTAADAAEAGSTIALQVARRGRVEKLELRVGDGTEQRRHITVIPGADEGTLRRREAWLGGAGAD